MKDFKFTISGKEHVANVLEHEGTLEVTVDGKIYTVTLPEHKPAAKPVVKPAVTQSAPVATITTPKPAAGANTVTAPLNGKIMQVMVKVGDHVNADDPVCTLEAMKMENTITAETGGTVKAVLVNPGDQVESGQGLIELA